MVLRSEQETMQSLIRDAITQLCKKHLHFKKGVNLEALVGITLDDDDIILVSVKESIKQSTPKKSPMQVALKSVQTAVQKVNAKSAEKKCLDEQTRPSIINIVPTNLPETAETPVAIGTIETESSVDSEINFDFLNHEVKEEVEDVVVKEEDDDDSYGGSADGQMVPGPVMEAEELLRSCAEPNVPSQEEANMSSPKRKTAPKRKMPAQQDDNPKVPRVFVPEGKPPVPLDVRYLGLNRSITDDREYKRGRFLERLIEGAIKWDELSEHQHNCAFAKAALRGREENEIVCSLCFQLFTKAQDYKKHIKSHFGGFNCSMCEIEFWSLEDLQSHLATHMFPCPLCNNSYTSKPDLTTHIRNDHSLFFQESTAQESPAPKKLEVSSKSNKQSNSESTARNQTGASDDRKTANPLVKTSDTTREENKEKVINKSVPEKANSMQVKVVPQLVRTGSADSEPEQNSPSKAHAPSVPVTRSRGKLN